MALRVEGKDLGSRSFIYTILSLVRRQRERAAATSRTTFDGVTSQKLRPLTRRWQECRPLGWNLNKHSTKASVCCKTSWMALN